MVFTQLTIENALKSGLSCLSKCNESRLETELLLAHVLKVTRIFLYTHASQLLSDKEQQQFFDLVDRRKRGEPIAYLLGHKEFWSIDLEVNPHTLIPRPETELLVQRTLDILPNKPLTMVDLGVGSGAVAIALALERPNWKIIATDISTEALLVAKKNAIKQGINNIEFIQSDWCEALPIREIDAIVSNPPYIAEGDPHLKNLRYEPLNALVAGPDGLSAIKKIIHQSQAYLKQAGWLLLEHGYNQSDQVKHLLKEKQYQFIKTHADLTGTMRVTIGQRKT